MAAGKLVSLQSLLVLATLLIISCTSLEKSASTFPEEGHTAPLPEIPAPLVYGRGLGETVDQALEAALRDAARKAAEALLGPGAVLKNQEVLDRLFSESFFPVREAYHRDSIEILGSEEPADSEGAAAVVRGRVDLPVLVSNLRQAGVPENQLPENLESVVLADEAAPGYAEAYLADRPIVKKPEPEPRAPAAYESESLDIRDLGRLKLNDSEKKRMGRYLGNLSFMVHSVRPIEAEDAYTREAAVELSRVLNRYGYACHYPDQVDEILAGQEETYRDETGGDVPFLQWTGKKLGANIFARVESDIDIRRDTGGYYASASVKIVLIDTQSWKEAVSLSSRESVPAFSAVSEQEAVSFALRSVMLELVPDVVSSAREAYSSSLLKGIPYELILLNPPEQRELRRFIDALQDDVRRISRISSSSEEERFELRFLGTIEELESLLFDVAGSIDGLDDFSPAYQKGNTLAFYTGLF